jgi:hypothetical protein
MEPKVGDVFLSVRSFPCRTQAPRCIARIGDAAFFNNRLTLPSRCQREYILVTPSGMVTLGKAGKERSMHVCVTQAPVGNIDWSNNEQKSVS